ncbi:agamous-like MADS-box protein AGL80 [Curcuma longa]|uniref:agamous-like MADS-box protein AGL80 n=1 Tax=Curcuma longa TaxID=136217 RepID=UPI003D9F14C1
MPRKKVALAWIAHDATRRATFKKRKRSLFKKTSELAILCGVDACAVVYGPEEAEPEVWPSPAEAARVLARLRAAPEPHQGRKKMDQEGFLRLRAAKLQDQIRRQQRDNRELEASLLLHEVLSAGGQRMCNAGIEEAAELVRLVEMKLVLVSNRVEREKARTLVEPPRPPAEQVVGASVAEVEPELTEEDLTALPWPELTEEDLAALPWPEMTDEVLAAVPLSCIDPESTWLELDDHQWQDRFDLFNNFN